MRNAFTLIELLITVSLILLMSVISVPVFNRYSAKNDLKVKAEEIKYFIEESYASAYSPDIQNSGSMIQIENSGIKKQPQSFGQECYKNINNCSRLEFTDRKTTSVLLDGYGINALKVGSSAYNSVKIFLLTPAQKENTSFCNIKSDNNYECKSTSNVISFNLVKEGITGLDPITFTIYKDPFRVETK